MKISDTRPGRNTPAEAVADDQGIDLPQLMDNLRLTPRERIRNHARALNAVHALRQAMRKTNARNFLGNSRVAIK